MSGDSSFCGSNTGAGSDTKISGHGPEKVF